MSLAVFYTPRSRETLKSVEFGAQSANKFALKAGNTISVIAEFPLMFKASSIDINVRVGLITKQTSLFYRVTDNSVHLLFFWDNRQEPILPR